MRKLTFIIIVLILNACSTNPYKVSKEDTQVQLNTELGTIIDVVPVKIQGETSDSMAIFGGLIGATASQNVGSGTGNELAILAGTLAGGVIGYYSTVKLGEHNGFMYTISVDNKERPVGVIQGEDKKKGYNFKVGDRATIVYGFKVRLLPTAN